MSDGGEMDKRPLVKKCKKIVKSGKPDNKKGKPVVVTRAAPADDFWDDNDTRHEIIQASLATVMNLRNGI